MINIDLKRSSKDFLIQLALIALMLPLYGYAEYIFPPDTYQLDFIFCGLLIIPVYLSLRFKNASICYFIFSCLLLIALLIAIKHQLLPIEESTTFKLAQWLILLYPVNFLLLKILKTTGFFTLSSGIFLASLVAESILLYWLTSQNTFTLLDPLLNINFMHLAAPNESFLQLALFMFLAGLTVQIVQLVMHTSSMQASLLGALLLSALGLYYYNSPYALAITSLGLCLSLSVAFIQDSYEMAFTDNLTQLPGRRSLELELQQLGSRYTIAMLDIDFFKKINDNYGHSVGDQVLKMVAKKIRAIEGGGKPARYGGEEFAIIFPGKSLHDAILHLEALRLSIENSPFKLRSKNRTKKIPKNKNVLNTKNHRLINVTVSIGVAERNHLNRSSEAVINAADTALYKAKKLGRNQLSH